MGAAAGPRSFCSVLVFRIPQLLKYRCRDTFTPCPLSRKLELLPAPFSPRLGFLIWSVWMTTPDKVEFGLLPERPNGWRTIATSYGIEAFLVLLLLGRDFSFRIPCG